MRWSADLVRRDRALVTYVDFVMAGAAASAGRNLSCHPGCTACCIGPFPITQLDAWRMRRGLAELDGGQAARARAVVERARAQAERFSDFRDDPEDEEFFARHEDESCPALDPETGLCELYEFRPLSCRTFGPPLRIGNERLPPCRLCFVGAPEARVEARRIDFDPAPLESPATRLAEHFSRTEAETLVAFALATP